ncbi:MAG: hypothetical protein CMP48_19150 [Rickettsiales bacterium]|nr:hypothetical protein [Rickettsiales bacterium]
MKINLKNYMSEREKSLHKQSIPGPAITVSRTYGCDEHEFVKALIRKLNQLRDKGLKSHAWKYINREIIEESAKQLKMQAYDVENRVMVHHEPQSEWFANFDSHKKLSDSEIIDVIKDMITTYAKKGNVIIIGRGGIGVVKSMPNSLHIRLNAPIDYRIGIVAKQMNMNPMDAEEMIRSIDNQRKKWAEHLIERPIDDAAFDLVFNMERMKVDEMSDQVVNLLVKRKLVG